MHLGLRVIRLITLKVFIMDKMQASRKFDSADFAQPDDEKANEEIDPVDLPPHEIVLSFDHILKQIFSFLNTPDLLTCRLVSHRFLQFAQRPLEKRIKKVFSHGNHESWDGEDNRGRTLAQLTAFLEQSTSESIDDIISFPCTNFCFIGTQLGNSVIQNFLNINGQNIRELTVSSPECAHEHESIQMEQLCTLLTIQAPHIENLSLRPINLAVDWQEGFPMEDSTNENSPPRNEHSPLLKTDPEYQELSSKVDSLPRKSNLKILKICGSGLAKTMELILQLSPKLQQVAIDRALYMCLLYPVSRIYLLKNLNFHPSFQSEIPSCINSMDILEKISQENTLWLRELVIDFRDTLEVFRYNLEFENNVVLMINRILEGSKDTLQSLTLTSFTFLRGMKMPTPMSELKELNIFEVDERTDTSWTIFPEGFSVTETFPRLTASMLNVTTKSSDLNLFGHDAEGYFLYEIITKLIFPLARLQIADKECVFDLVFDP